MRRADCRRRFAQAADDRLSRLVLGFTITGAVLLARLAQIVIAGLISSANAQPVAAIDRADIVDRNGVPLARSIPVHSIRVVKANLMHDPRVLAQQLAAIFPEKSADYFYDRMTTDIDEIIGAGAAPGDRARASALLRQFKRDGKVSAFAAGLADIFPDTAELRYRRAIEATTGWFTASMITGRPVPASKRLESNAAIRRFDEDRDSRQLAAVLARLFPETPVHRFTRLIELSRSAVIQPRATPEQLNAVNQLAEIGFEYPEEPERLYPQGNLASHVLGFLAPGRGGVMGIEKLFESRLTDPQLRSNPLQLSLDTRVQAALELELDDAVTKLEAKGGAGLVLDVDTGEVLAMASLPTFDPNHVRFATDEAQWNGVTFNTYELGSTFKPITIAAAMDAGVVTSMARRYDATHPIKVGGHTIRDSHPLNRWLNVPETLVHSSNIVTAQIAEQLGGDRLRATFRALEFDRRPRIELPERGLPMWSRPWGLATTMTAGFGHSVKVTPLHLASAYAALVNGGYWRPATLMKLAPGQVPQGRRVFSDATSARMRQLLRMIVASGTGKSADAPGYRVGGKTGSAERVINGSYVGNSVTATFAAAFPMDHPRYVILVMIDRPPGNAYSQGQRTAAYTAAPVVRKVVQRIGPMVGIYPDASHDVDISELEPLLWKPQGEQ